MNTTSIVGIIILIIAVGAITGYLVLNPNEKRSATTTSEPYTTTPIPQLSTETTTTPTATSNTVVQEWSSGGNITVWDTYDNVELIPISPYYDENIQRIVSWPALLNGTLYALQDISVTYRITSSEGFNATINISWSLTTNQSYTALCTDIEGNIISEETFYNVYLVKLHATWTGGGEIDYTAYPINVSALYWFHTMPPFDIPDHGMWIQGVLGGTTTSPTGSLTWSCAAAKDPKNINLVENCHPYFRYDRDPFAVFNDETYREIDEYATNYLVFNLIPPELFDYVTHELASVTDVKEDEVVSTVPDYDSVSYKITYIGKLELPGEGIPVDAWRVEFETIPDILKGYYILTASTTTPLEFKISFLPLNEPEITIEYKLNTIHILYNWNLPLQQYLGQ